VTGDKVIGSLYHRLRQWADKTGGRESALRDLPRLLIDLRETANPVQLADAILMQVQRGVQASRGALMAEDKVIGAFGITVDEAADHGLFPTRVKLAAEHCDLEGWLLLGPRVDGREEQALKAVAGPIVWALTIVQQRERTATERHWLFHSLDMRLTQLEMMLAARN
jgi:hypothetical protein